jgi:hypothetical protein
MNLHENFVNLGVIVIFLQKYTKFAFLNFITNIKCQILKILIQKT